ncbi:MAG TPA: hypothetical protein VNA26_09305, partial [Chitinophagaceae bacterium]|nr:hypothetical protein [Chitinophagaceae bacterium]
MKKVLLLTFGFVLSLTMSAQLCTYILGFQLNSGKGGCPATAPCVTADPTSPLYIVEARLSILFTSSFTLPASPIVITSIQVIGETSPRPFIFCENVAA